MHIIDRSDRPFSYLLAEDFLSPKIEAGLLDWFEDDAPWQLVSEDFYDQYEFSLFDADLPSAIAPLIDPRELASLRRCIGEEFNVTLSPRIELVAHKLVEGQRIGIHNDYLPGRETHRLTVQLNRGLADEHGGYLMLFNSGAATDVHRVLRPISGTALGFAIGPESHHAVSRMYGGVRFTLVYSFHADDH